MRRLPATEKDLAYLHHACVFVYVCVYVCVF
jgi:hypothetical protein